MIRLGLTGYPLGHSLSPAIHAAALRACRMDGEYSLYPIGSNDLFGLKELLRKIRIGELQGLNVTIPHKQNAIEYLDELTPTAQAIGAVNTIFMRYGNLVGDNTDAPGFSADLKRFLPPSAFNSDSSAIVLGAGGSARAVVHALLQDGWDVTIAARRLEVARRLALSFLEHPVRTIQFESFIDHPPFFGLLVNATPLGMAPNVEVSPLPDGFAFPARASVYDLVYNPRETKLVRQARASGHAAVSGLGMLVAQAALAFQIWTGQMPPRDVLMGAVEA
jgi:shikimate dehydrogenase